MIKSVRMQNIRSYRDETVHFPVGSILLSGNIGSGKSTILQAIEYALFGIQKGATAQNLLRHGQSSGSVELTFEANGTDITVERKLKKGRGIRQDECTMTAGGKTYAYTPTQLKAKILEIFGYPKEALSRNIPIYRYTVYTPQEEMKAIMLDPETRRATLRKIFGVEKYENVRNNSLLFAKYLRTERRILEETSRTLDEKAAAMEKSGKEAAIINEELEKQRETLAIATEDLRKEEVQLEEMREKANEIRALEQKAASASAEAAHLSSLAKAYAKDAEETEAKTADTANAVRRIEKDLEAFSSARSAQEIDEEEGSVAEQKTDALAKKAVLEEEIRKLTRIKDSGQCPLCLRNVSDGAHFVSEVEKRKAEAASASAQLASLEEAESRLRKERDMLHSKEMLSQKLADTKKALQESARRAGMRNDEMKNMNEKIELLRREIAFSSAKIASGKDYEEEYRKHGVRIREIHSLRLELSSAVSKKEQALSSLMQKLEELSAETERMKEMRSRAERMKEAGNWIETSLFAAAENIEKHVMNVLQREFDSIFQYWFSVLMPDEAMSVRIDETFSPVITQNNYETSYENLSGGERTALALAYRLSLNKIINIMIDTIKTGGLLILDEPTEGFSAEQLDRVRDVINQLDLEQIILVSHDPKMDTFVESILRVYKDDHVSKVEQPGK